MSYCKYNNCINYITNKNNLICDDHIKLLNIYEKPTECPICLQTLTDEFPVFPCAHWICKSCILNSSNHNCPFCRQQIYLTLEESDIINTNITRINKASEIQQIEDDRLLAEQLNNESYDDDYVDDEEYIDNEEYDQQLLYNFMNGVIFGGLGRYSITEMYDDYHNTPSMNRRNSNDETAETDEDDYLD